MYFAPNIYLVGSSDFRFRSRRRVRHFLDVLLVQIRLNTNSFHMEQVRRLFFRLENVPLLLIMCVFSSPAGVEVQKYPQQNFLQFPIKQLVEDGEGNPSLGLVPSHAELCCCVLLAAEIINVYKPAQLIHMTWRHQPARRAELGQQGGDGGQAGTDLVTSWPRSHSDL